jgi:hypothetical protein
MSGTLADANPSTVTVAFTGVLSGSTTADTSGNFSLTADAIALGTINAVATDSQQLHSSSTPVTLTCPRPGVSLSLSYVTRNQVDLFGSVSAQSPDGLTITFSGVVTGTATTDATGHFDVVKNATGVGQVQATVTDVWAQVSDAAAVTVSDDAPVISNFHATNVGAHQWTISGTVSDFTPGGLTVQLGGIPELNGKTATTDAEGDFSITITVPAGENGTVWATCTDWFNLTSNTAQFTFQD